MKEELEIEITSNPILLCTEYHKTSSGEANRIHYFLVKQWTGSMVSNEAESVYWESDPRKLTAEADKKAMKRVL